MAEKKSEKKWWSRNIKLDEVEDKDVIAAAERMGTTLLFRQAVLYYLAREPYAIYPERAMPRQEESEPNANSIIENSNENKGKRAKLQGI